MSTSISDCSVSLQASPVTQLALFVLFLADKTSLSFPSNSPVISNPEKNPFSPDLQDLSLFDLGLEDPYIFPMGIFL